MHTAYLGLGSNLGNRKRNMLEAVKLLNGQVGEVVATSSFYETAPWGFDSPNKFINICVRVSTPLTPRQLLEATQRIEHLMGRVEKSHNGIYHDRIIDIDILLFDDIHIDDSDLVIPHPFMKERDFVMTPLREIIEPSVLERL
ncbi:2-amino-4-hydroxy-6-hydroxymethyldihydropteridine diphosphokinase [Prevotella sp.]|uniref:2-amino-4-hydroxy-6- hydroxymethyldihydropteridine diphosphokinase n=1 Tax=Prevotella sp. TaxID=59823 RepID=UPI002F92075E